MEFLFTVLLVHFSQPLSKDSPTDDSKHIIVDLYLIQFDGHPY
jgi:hypothetical protein